MDSGQLRDPCPTPNRKGSPPWTNATHLSETLAETFHALRDTATKPVFAMKRQANRLMAALVAHVDAGGLCHAVACRQARRQSGQGAGGGADDWAGGQRHRQQQKAHGPAPAPQAATLSAAAPTAAAVYQPRVPAACAIEMDSSNYGTVQRCIPKAACATKGSTTGCPIAAARSASMASPTGSIPTNACARPGSASIANSNSRVRIPAVDPLVPWARSLGAEGRAASAPLFLRATFALRPWHEQICRRF